MLKYFFQYLNVTHNVKYIYEFSLFMHISKEHIYSIYALIRLYKKNSQCFLLAYFRISLEITQNVQYNWMRLNSGFQVAPQEEDTCIENRGTGGGAFQTNACH